jgi:hypothetical protein
MTLLQTIISAILRRRTFFGPYKALIQQVTRLAVQLDNTATQLTFYVDFAVAAPDQRTYVNYLNLCVALSHVYTSSLRRLQAVVDGVLNMVQRSLDPRLSVAEQIGAIVSKIGEDSRKLQSTLVQEADLVEQMQAPGLTEAQFELLIVPWRRLQIEEVRLIRELIKIGQEKILLLRRLKEINDKLDAEKDDYDKLVSFIPILTAKVHNLSTASLSEINAGQAELARDVAAVTLYKEQLSRRIAATAIYGVLKPLQAVLQQLATLQWTASLIDARHEAFKALHRPLLLVATPDPTPIYMSLERTATHG